MKKRKIMKKSTSPNLSKLKSNFSDEISSDVLKKENEVQQSTANKKVLEKSGQHITTLKKRPMFLTPQRQISRNTIEDRGSKSCLISRKYARSLRGRVPLRVAARNSLQTGGLSEKMTSIDRYLKLQEEHNEALEMIRKQKEKMRLYKKNVQLLKFTFSEIKKQQEEKDEENLLLKDKLTERDSQIIQLKQKMKEMSKEGEEGKEESVIGSAKKENVDSEEEDLRTKEVSEKRREEINRLNDLVKKYRDDKYLFKRQYEYMTHVFSKQLDVMKKYFD